MIIILPILVLVAKSRTQNNLPKKRTHNRFEAHPEIKHSPTLLLFSQQQRRTQQVTAVPSLT